MGTLLSAVFCQIQEIQPCTGIQHYSNLLLTSITVGGPNH